MLVITIETQILLIALITIALIGIICFQVIRLGRYMKAGFGKIEVIAWIILLLYRIYGYLWGYSEQIAQAKEAGIIKDSFTFNQWVQIGGNLLFLGLIIFSKHREKRTYKIHWGV